MLIGFAVSSIPGDAQNERALMGFVPPALQNLLHMPFFGLLAWLWVRSFLKLGQPFIRAAVLAALVSLVWGVLDEIHQYYVPGRFASLTDMALNASGILVVIAVLVHQDRKPRGGTPLSGE